MHIRSIRESTPRRCRVLPHVHWQGQPLKCGMAGARGTTATCAVRGRRHAPRGDTRLQCRVVRRGTAPPRRPRPFPRAHPAAGNPSSRPGMAPREGRNEMAAARGMCYARPGATSNLIKLASFTVILQNITERIHIFSIEKEQIS